MFAFLNKTTLMLGLVLILALGAISYYAYSEHTKRSLESQIAELNIKNIQQSQIIASQNLFIQQKEAEIKKNKQLLEKASKAFSDITNDTNAAKDSLNNTDLTSKDFADEKTNSIFRCFELLSGAVPNEKELSAKTPQEFNSSCSWMFSTISLR